jgi:PhnB protein
MNVRAYLFFEGRCHEAVEFYRKALGADVLALMRYKESPDPTMCSPGTAENVMHARLRIGDTELFASDGRCSGQPSFAGFALSLEVSDEADAEGKFKALADGEQVQMPLGTTFFARKFGMVADRFGVPWMIYLP